MDAWSRVTQPFALLLVMGILVSGCASLHTRSTRQFIDDSAISTQVKSALFQTPDVNGFGVKVDTYKGRVTLSGLIDSPREKQKAGAIAHSVQGVREVVNNLAVKPK